MSNLRGYPLAKNISAVADQAAVTVVGGRFCLCIFATTFPTICNLQMLGKDATTWINVNQTTISQNQVTPFDLPSGQYRMHLSGGSVSGLYADLVSVGY